MPLVKKISKSYSPLHNIQQELRILFMVYCATLLWLFTSIMWHINVVICPFRLITSWPCPACGTTRGLLLLLNSQFLTAFKSNLNLIFIIPAFCFYTPSLLSDTFFHTDIVMRSYIKWCKFVTKKWIFYTFLTFELMVWITHFIWL
ncbi:DUF2752 domain-containing protein [Hoylesella saccharolytica]|uniref:DUF2752 domain-containing protein n=1 Tax=Hoylesella saccharolytica TaxID=633701 RepID=UPI0036F34397